VSVWVEDYRRYWEQSYDRLDAYLERLQGKKEPRHARKKK